MAGLAAADFGVVWGFLGLNILTPGPNVMTTIAVSMAGGRVAGLGSACGVALGIGGWCLGMTLGLGAVFAAWPEARPILTVIAIGLLGWFTARFWRAAWAGWSGRRRRLPEAAPAIGFRAAFLRSLAVNALNPKALTSWIAILALFPLSRAGMADVAILWAGASLLAFAIHMLYALAFSTGPAARLYLRAGWAVSAFAGAVFAVFALRLALGLLRP